MVVSRESGDREGVNDLTISLNHAGIWGIRLRVKGALSTLDKELRNERRI
jgi:hypothetical protein